MKGERSLCKPENLINEEIYIKHGWIQGEDDIVYFNNKIYEECTKLEAQ